MTSIQANTAWDRLLRVIVVTNDTTTIIGFDPGVEFPLALVKSS